jgi:hypothetical protein
MDLPMLEELLENIDEAHKDLVVTMDYYERQVKELADYVKAQDLGTRPGIG